MTQPRQVVFFIDRALESKRLLQALKESGAIIERHSDHFAPDTIDTEWLPVVSQKGWVILTKDARIGRNPLEVMAIANAKASVFILWSGNLPSQEVAALFSDIVSKLEKFALNNASPFIAKVYKNRSVLMWKNCNQLAKIISKS
jgi:predicted nuclease of predicted toxin-antitoxin system